MKIHLLKINIFKNGFAIFISIFSYNLIAQQIIVPVCPKIITVKDNKVIDAPNWKYDAGRNFIDLNTKKMNIKDGILKSDSIFPHISQINTFTNSVTGYLSPDSEIIKNDFESYTWNIHEINITTEAVFLCAFYGNQQTERPIRLIYLYKNVPKTAKTCTSTIKLKNENYINESRKLSCTE